jgi:hypothetical protein
VVEPASHLDRVGKLAQALAALGLEPILVGGMALVTLGSRRVTRDFDFVIPHPGDRLPRFVDVLYAEGLELASRVDAGGDVRATIHNPRVAAVRLRLDDPSSAYFVDPDTGLRIDLLFDFPLPAADLATRASRTTIRSRLYRIASPADLLRLKAPTFGGHFTWLTMASSSAVGKLRCSSSIGDGPSSEAPPDVRRNVALPFVDAKAPVSFR